MSFPTSIAENVRNRAEKLIEMVSGEGGQSQTAHEIEEQLWWELLAMGQQLMQAFFTNCEQQETGLFTKNARSLLHCARLSSLSD